MLRRFPATLLGLTAILPVACNKSAPQGGPVATSSAAAPAVNKSAEYDLTRLAADMKAANPEKRAKAIRMAADLDDYGEDVIPVLLTALKDKTAGKLGGTSDRPDSTRETAVLALLELKAKGKKALLDTGLKTLEQGLRDKEPNVREHTVNAFRLVGPDAKGSAEAITKLCADPEKEVRSAAYRALEKIKAVPTVSILSYLNHPNVDVASEAAANLSWLKPLGPEALPPLIDALKRQPRAKEEPNDIQFIRNAAAEALANVSKGAETAVPALVDQIKASKKEDLERIMQPKPGDSGNSLPGPVQALRRMGKSAAAGVAPLLKDPEPIVRFQAAAVISGLSVADAADVLPQVQEALNAERGLPSASLEVFEELVAAALNLGAETDKITGQVIENLKSEQEVVRFRSAKSLGRIGRKAAPAVPKLIELLNDPVALVVLASIDALGFIGPAAKDAVPELAKKVEGDDPNMGRAAAVALRGIGKDLVPAVPALTKALESNDQIFVIEAANTLAVAGPDAVGAVEAIAKQLVAENTRRDEKIALLQATAAIGPPAKGAISAVNKLLGEKDLPVRVAAAETLGRIGDGNPEALKKLGEILKDIKNTPPGVQAAVLRAIAGMGAKAKAASGDVKAHLDTTRDPAGKIWASATLVAIGTDADANAKVVLTAIKDVTPQAKPARVAAIEAAEFLGPKAKPGVPDLIEALKDKSPAGRTDTTTVRDRAARTLGRLGTTATAAIRPLTDLLRDNDAGIARSAAVALGQMGPDAVVAAPKLRELARSKPELAGVANAALDRIEPPKKME